MNEARKVFEALSRNKDLTRKGDGYANTNTHTRWKYFLLGWDMAKATQ